MSQQQKQKPRQKKQKSEDQDNEKIDFVYDDKWEKYLGPRTGLYFGVVNDRKHYDGYRRYSDYMTYASISSEIEQSNNRSQQFNQKQVNFKQNNAEKQQNQIRQQNQAKKKQNAAGVNHRRNSNVQNKRLQSEQQPFVSTISTIKKIGGKQTSPIVSRNSSYFKYAQLLDQMNFPQESPDKQISENKNLQYQGQQKPIRRQFNPKKDVSQQMKVKKQQTKFEKPNNRKFSTEDQVTDEQFYFDDKVVDQIAKKHRQWEQEQRRLQEGAQRLKEQINQHNKKGRPSLLNPKIGKKQEANTRKSVKFNEIKQTKNMLTESIRQQIITVEESDVLDNVPFLKNLQSEQLQKKKQMDMQKGLQQKRQSQANLQSKKPQKSQREQQENKPNKKKSKFAKATQQNQMKKIAVKKKQQPKQKQGKVLQSKQKKPKRKSRQIPSQSEEQEKLVKNYNQFLHDQNIRFPNEQQKKEIQKQVKRKKQTKKPKKQGEFPKIKRWKGNKQQRISPQQLQTGQYQFVPLSDSQDDTWDENGNRYPKRHRPGKVVKGKQKLLYKGSKLIGKLQKKTILKEIDCQYTGAVKLEHQITKQNQDQVHGFIKIPPNQQIRGVLGIHDFIQGQVSYQHSVQSVYPVSVHNGTAEFDLKDRPQLSPGTQFIIKNKQQKNSVKVKFILKKNRYFETKDKQEEQ